MLKKKYENKPSYYSVIPSEVRYDNTLTPYEILLYGEITALSNRKGYCWANNRYFSSLYEVAPQSVSRWIKHLKEKGYINVIYYDSNKRIISINNNVNRPLTKMLSPFNNYVKHNNKKKINNINNNINKVFEEVREKNDF